jgi:hypothetical protein
MKKTILPLKDTSQGEELHGAVVIFLNASE